MTNVIALVIVGVLVVVLGILRWRAVRRARANALPPLFFPLTKERAVTTEEAWRSIVPRDPPKEPPHGGTRDVAFPVRPSANGAGSSVPPTRAVAGAEGWPVPVPDRQDRPDVSPPARSASGAHSPPAPLRVVRDLPGPDADEPASTETVRFRRPVDEPVQLLPGRLEVLSGDPRHQEIRFVRVPGRPAELILGREPGDTAQHVALRSSTVSRQHARFVFADGRWQVMNLSQTNPVVINGEELAAADGGRGLTDGDRIELGEVVLRFRAH